MCTLPITKTKYDSVPKKKQVEDPDELQLKDELNSEWVDRWKK